MLYYDCIESIKANIMINDKELDFFYDDLRKKELLFIDLLKSKKIGINEDTIRKVEIKKSVEVIICYLEILEYVKDKSLSLPKLVLKDNIKNENMSILLYLEATSECIKNIVKVFKYLIEYYDVSKNEVNDLKNEFIESLNPMTNYEDNEINLLLSLEPINNEIDFLINKSKINYRVKIKEYILKLINKLY